MQIHPTTDRLSPAMTKLGYFIDRTDANYPIVTRGDGSTFWPLRDCIAAVFVHDNPATALFSEPETDASPAPLASSETTKPRNRQAYIANRINLRFLGLEERYGHNIPAIQNIQLSIAKHGVVKVSIEAVALYLPKKQTIRSGSYFTNRQTLLAIHEGRPVAASFTAVGVALMENRLEDAPFPAAPNEHVIFHLHWRLQSIEPNFDGGFRGNDAARP